MEKNRESISFCIKSEESWIDSNILIHFSIPFHNFPKKNQKIETKKGIFQRTDGIVKRIDSFFVERNYESTPFFWQRSGIVNRFLYLTICPLLRAGEMAELRSGKYRGAKSLSNDTLFNFLARKVAEIRGFEVWNSKNLGFEKNAFKVLLLLKWFLVFNT